LILKPNQPKQQVTINTLNTMQKPTTQLNYAIISHVITDAQIAQMLSERDNHPQTTGVAIRCEFYKPHPTNHHRSGYHVDFVYSVNSDVLEHKDDISVLVEVIEGNPVTFNIINVKTY
jgi:adenine C2-methylase RlmN of 23S rRNA A2503 and tRNA A37